MNLRKPNIDHIFQVQIGFKFLKEIVLFPWNFKLKIYLDSFFLNTNIKINVAEYEKVLLGHGKIDCQSL